MSLRSSFMLIFTALVAAPLLLFWAWPHSRAQLNERAEAYERHLLLARNLGSTLKRYHGDVASTFEYLSGEMAAGREITNADTILTNLRITHLCLIDPAQSRIVGIVGRGPAVGTPIPSARLQNWMALAAEGSGTVFSGAEANKEGTPVIYLVRMLGEHLALAAVDTSYFVELGRSIRFGLKGHAVIVDRAGRVLAHPLPQWEADRRDISKVSAVKRILGGETGVDIFYSPAYKDDMIAGFAAVRGTGWGVMVPQPLSEMREKAERAHLSGFFVVAIGLLGAALVAVRVALTLVGPLNRLIVGARLMEHGNTDVRIHVRGRMVPREVRDLVSSFNAMASAAQEARVRELAALTKAEQANASKSEFLRTVTHELRSPLCAMIGFSELLAAERHGPLAPSYRQYARDIRIGSRHLLSLVNDLLDLAKIEAGQYTIADETVCLGETAARAVRYVSEKANERGVTVAVRHADAVPAVRGDERALFQSILNLVSNAVRYGRDNGTVTIQTRTLAAGGLEIEVSDDGPGIAAEDLARVMLPFQRVTSDANRRVEGSGLGLPIVKRLVELHGGVFVLESEVGKGTTARIRLPADRVLDNDEGDSGPAPGEPAKAAA